VGIHVRNTDAGSSFSTAYLFIPVNLPCLFLDDISKIVVMQGELRISIHTKLLLTILVAKNSD
jgi:hypothetical protein